MRSETKMGYAEQILVVLVHIQTDLDGDLRPSRLAEVACVSRFHFHRVFTGMVGESVGRHVRRLRLERAAVQLRDTGIAITEAGELAGYSAPEAFSRAFRAAFGRSPRDFRRAGVASDGTSPPARIDSPNGVHLVGAGQLPAFRPVTAPDAEAAVRVEDVDVMTAVKLRHHGP